MAGLSSTELSKPRCLFPTEPHLHGVSFLRATSAHGWGRRKPVPKALIVRLTEQLATDLGVLVSLRSISKEH